MLALKLVIDTNVLISAILNPLGNERAVLDFALTAPAELYHSKEILEEYQQVLSRPKFKIDAKKIEKIIHLITSRGQEIVTTSDINISQDSDDNKFLACAYDAKADYLITGNLKHFPTFWHRTKIVNARIFLTIIFPHLR
jgi:putative PIN family toxin of toxin-antitoxin system